MFNTQERSIYTTPESLGHCTFETYPTPEDVVMDRIQGFEEQIDNLFNISTQQIQIIQKKTQHLVSKFDLDERFTTEDTFEVRRLINELQDTTTTIATCFEDLTAYFARYKEQLQFILPRYTYLMAKYIESIYPNIQRQTAINEEHCQFQLERLKVLEHFLVNQLS